MAAIDAQDARMISFVMAIAESNTLEDLGVWCHRAAGSLIQAPVLGLYLIGDRSPDLLYSHNAPRGFLEEYGKELASHDPMIEMIISSGRSATGATLYPSRRWNVRVMSDLLSRWGFRGNMCGPVFVDSRLAGLIYTADVEEISADPTRESRLDFICRSAAIALRRISSAGDGNNFASGDLTDPSQTPAHFSELPPRLSQVAALLCRGRTNKEIARNMEISHHTVKEHVAALCARFNAQNRTELAAAMLKSGPFNARALQLGAIRSTKSRGVSPAFHLSKSSTDYF